MMAPLLTVIYDHDPATEKSLQLHESKNNAGDLFGHCHYEILQELRRAESYRSNAHNKMSGTASPYVPRPNLPISADSSGMRLSNYGDLRCLCKHNHNMCSHLQLDHGETLYIDRSCILEYIRPTNR